MHRERDQPNDDEAAPACILEHFVRKNGYLGEVVKNLHELVRAGRRFATVYADPPWPYDNESSRAAAVSHYPVLSLDEIAKEPVAALVEPDAHVHLWTTNSFLREALERHSSRSRPGASAIDPPRSG